MTFDKFYKRYFFALVKRANESITKQFNWEECEELVQEVMLVVHNSWDKPQGLKELMARELTDDWTEVHRDKEATKLRLSWALKVLSNRIQHILRNRERMNRGKEYSNQSLGYVESQEIDEFGDTSFIGDGKDYAVRSYDPEAIASAEQEMDHLRGCIPKLDFGIQLAVDLVILRGFPYQQAADLLGVPINTVASRINRARAQLAEFNVPAVRGRTLVQQGVPYVPVAQCMKNIIAARDHDANQYREHVLSHGERGNCYSIPFVSDWDTVSFEDHPDLLSGPMARRQGELFKEAGAEVSRLVPIETSCNEIVMESEEDNPAAPEYAVVHRNRKLNPRSPFHVRNGYLADTDAPVEGWVAGETNGNGPRDHIRGGTYPANQGKFKSPLKGEIAAAGGYYAPSKGWLYHGGKRHEKVRSRYQALIVREREGLSTRPPNWPMVFIHNRLFKAKEQYDANR